MEQNTAEFAVSFLCKRNPFDDVPQWEYSFKIMDFQGKMGDEAIEALAGFYIYAIHEIKGEKGSHAIESTFAHDLNGYNTKGFLPRSSEYRNFWLKQFERYNFKK